MDPTALNNLFNQFIGAVKDNNRIVIRTEEGRESFEIRSPNARLNNIYTTSHTEVARRIGEFCRTNIHLNREKCTEFCVAVRSKLTEVNSRRSGFFNWIILIFNRSLRARLNNEFQFLSPLNTNLQELLRSIPASTHSPHPSPLRSTSAVDAASEQPANELLHNPSPQPDTQIISPPPQPPSSSSSQTIPPQPSSSSSQPLPSPPPPPPSSSSSSSSSSQTIPPPPPPPHLLLSPTEITSLFTPLQDKLPNEPKAPFIPRTGPITSEQIAQGEAYITNLTELLKPFKEESERLRTMEEGIQPVIAAIEELNSEISQCQEMIDYLESDTDHDFIHVNFPFQNPLTRQKGHIQVPILTARAYREYCETAEDDKTTSSSSSSSEAPRQSVSQDQVLDTVGKRGDTGRPTISKSDDSPSPASGVAAMRMRFQPALHISQSAPNVMSSSPRPLSRTKSTTSLTPKRPDFDILNVPYIVEMQRAKIAVCKEQLEGLQSEKEQFERQYQALQENLIPKIRTIVAQKETYLRECERSLNRRKQNFAREMGRAIPAVATAARSSEPKVEETCTTGLSKRETLTARYQQLITAQADQSALELNLRATVRGKQESQIIGGFKKSFFGLISIP
jgi:hypothetical protein